MLTPASGSFFSFTTLPLSFPVVPAMTGGTTSVEPTTMSTRIRVRLDDMTPLLSRFASLEHVGRGTPSSQPRRLLGRVPAIPVRLKDSTLCLHPRPDGKGRRTGSGIKRATRLGPTSGQCQLQCWHQWARGTVPRRHAPPAREGSPPLG